MWPLVTSAAFSRPVPREDKGRGLVLIGRRGKSQMASAAGTTVDGERLVHATSCAFQEAENKTARDERRSCGIDGRHRSGLGRNSRGPLPYKVLPLTFRCSLCYPARFLRRREGGGVVPVNVVSTCAAQAQRDTLFHADAVENRPFGCFWRFSIAAAYDYGSSSATSRSSTAISVSASPFAGQSSTWPHRFYP